MVVKDFIREYGVEKAREALTRCCWMDGSFCTRLWHGCVQNNHECCVDVKDLKRLVASIEIVELFESIENAKEAHRNNIEFHFVLVGDRKIIAERLCQAIADHESIYSVLRIDDMGDDSNLDHHVSPFCEVRDV